MVGDLRDGEIWVQLALFVPFVAKSNNLDDLLFVEMKRGCLLVSKFVLPILPRP